MLERKRAEKRVKKIEKTLRRTLVRLNTLPPGDNGHKDNLIISMQSM
jgi:hypothetical protein